MFLETKKEGEIQQAAPSLVGFVAWLGMQNPRGKYDYSDCHGGCLVGRYVNSIGLKWDQHGGPGQTFLSTDLGRLMNRIACGGNRSFGGALALARMALRQGFVSQMSEPRMVIVHRDLYYHEVAYVCRLEALAKAIVDNDPNDMAADAVTCLDVWRKEARDLLEK